MNSLIPTLNSREMVKGFLELNRKIIKGAETLTKIKEVDVGSTPADLVYQQDKIKLYHYRPEGEVTCRVPLLIVYALVNRHYILDLQPDRSLIRNLLQQGLDIYIIDWDYPTKADMYLGLDDYINGYLNDCVDFIRKETGNGKINLMGICQGGTFCATYSAIYPEKVKNLSTLVAPFDFSTNDALLFAWSKHMNVDALVDTYRVVPGDFLNSGFLMLMPFTLNIGKYVDMMDVIEDKDKLLNFLRMEKWIFDSPGQAGKCLREFIKEYYQGNKLVKGELKIGGKPVDLRNITMPLLNIYASSDHLVPPSATKPLNDFVGSTDKSLYEFQGGHIGVFVGSKSQKALAPFISKWFHERQDDGFAKGVPVESKPLPEIKEESRPAGIQVKLEIPQPKPETTFKPGKIQARTETGGGEPQKARGGSKGTSRKKKK